MAPLSPGPVEVPLVGQPSYFWGAVGTRFELRTRCNRTELYLGQHLIYTVRVTAVGNALRPPERPRLDEVPRFQQRFKIDWFNQSTTGDASQPDRILADQRSWEFDYRLRPLSEQVERIPPLPFVWYRPNRHPHPRGWFETTYDEGLALRVKPIPSETIQSAPKPIQVPEAFFQAVVGPDVLRREQLFVIPSTSLLALVLLLPPTLAGVWYVLWQRLYPDAARQARLRHSRAARVALRALATIRDPQSVERLTAIAVDYLRQRFDLPMTEPTPLEVAQHLERAGAATETVKYAVDFFQTCDTVRFAPPAARMPTDLGEAVRRLILTLEAETWSPPC